MRARTLPAAAGGLLLLAACTSRPQSPETGAWERFDLWRQPARVEISALPPGEPPDRRQVSYLGAREVRDLSQVPPHTFASFPHQAAGLVRVIEQAAGSRLSWTATLGREPYLSFTPLAEEASPCACTLRAGVRQGGTITELYRGEPGGTLTPAPAAVALDLAPWAGREVEVLLQVDGPAGGRARWASPAVYSRRPAAPRARRPPNLLLLGIDTLRADQVGAYRDPSAPPWGGPSLTPAIDRLAAASDLYLSAYSTFNVTNPSFASILTGLYGKNHGVYDLKTPLPASHTTLAELFRAAGYDTLAVISASHLGDHNSGLGQGFDEVVLASEHYAAELAVEAAMDWIAARERPFFAWVHLFDPHTPHTPPRPYALGFRPSSPAGLGRVPAWLPFRDPGPVAYDQPVLAGHRDLYRAEVAYLDRQIDRLLGFVDSRGLLAGTIVALVSDHGENLGDHGLLYRHIGLWETTTRVPMMIRWPGAEGRGREIPGLVQTLDLFPTLLAGAGLEVPPQDGIDLRRLAGGGRPGRPAVFAEHASQLGLTVRTASHRYMRSSGNLHVPDGPHLFDLARDPGETDDLAGGGLEVEERLAALLDRWLADRRPAAPTRPLQLSEEEEERLRALGYL